MNQARSTIVIVAMTVALITAWIDWPCVHNGLLHWDDDVYLEHVIALKRLSVQTITWAFTDSIKTAGYYHPLSWLSHLVDYQFWGLNATGFHATNVVLHALSACLVVLYMAKLLSMGTDLRPLERLTVATGTGLVFGIHPLQVESVAWVAERKTLLCVFLGLLCLWAHLKCSEHRGRSGWWWMMTLLFTVSLLAKPMAVSWPLMMLVIDWYPLRRHVALGWKRLLLEKLPMLMLAACLSIATFVTQLHQGALAETQYLSGWGRCLLVARNVVFYLWKLIWPIWLSPFYPQDEAVSFRLAEFWVSLIVLILLILSAIWYRKRLPALAAAWTGYLGLILPVSGIIPLGSYTVADRYMYAAMLPPIALGIGSIVWLWTRLGRLGRTVLAALIICQVLFFGHMSRAQIAVWRSDESLWQAVLDHFPSSPFANCQMAMAMADHRHFKEALAFAQQAVDSAPDFPQAHATLGAICVKTHAYSRAVEQLQQAISLDGTLSAARYNLVCAHARLGQLSEAYDGLQKLLASHPEYAALASHDGELAALRNEPNYAARLADLVAAAQKQ